MHSPIIEKLRTIFAKFPTVGPRTASRFVFYLTKLSKEEIEELLKAIEELKQKIKNCSFCGKSFEPNQIVTKHHDDIKQAEKEAEKIEICPICSDPRKDKSIVCIVEKEEDLEAIEKTNQFKGLYFILGGTISGSKKEADKKQIEEQINKLIERVKKEKTEEIILALNPTVEGQTTTLWLKRKLEPTKIKVTQLAKGLPVGGELEYADEETLSSALDNRK